MSVCAVIVAGGRSSRMGREKAFELVRGRTILERIIARLQEQVGSVILNANAGAERFLGTGLAVFGDIRPDIGTPLAGLHTALHLANDNGFDAVLTVPCDVPFLPSDLLQRLTGAELPAAIAASGGQRHYVTGLWSRCLIDRLERTLSEGRNHRLQDWAHQCEAAVVDWSASPYDPFFNVNTPQELAEAERIAAEFGL
jgi:molybdopterin-guanine dinucleotide biosynthesis protein A